jgi:hypothetical protein
VRRYEKPTAARTHFYAFAAFRAGPLLRLVPLLSIRCPSLSKISSDEEILPELAKPQSVCSDSIPAKLPTRSSALLAEMLSKATFGKGVDRGRVCGAHAIVSSNGDQ